MQKNKSHKYTDKSMQGSNKKQTSPTAVKHMIKEIGELKKQLVSIKSKKYLQTQPNHTQSGHNCNHMQSGCNHNQSHFHQLKSNPHHDLSTTNPRPQQNVMADCLCRKINQEDSTAYKHSIENAKPMRIQLCAINSTKSRQVKLKINVQLSKIKSALQKLIFNNAHNQTIQLIVAEFNNMMTFLNSIFKDYELQIANKKNDYRKMRQQLSQITANVLTLAQNSSTQKSITASQIEQIAELKRYLSYYMQLMEDSKNQADRCTKDYVDLQNYIRELENNNEIIKKQLKISEQKREELNAKILDHEKELLKVQTINKMLQSDCQLLKVQSEKNRSKRKQIDVKLQSAMDELKTYEQKLKNKQSSLNKQSAEIKQLMQIINNLKDEHTNLSLSLTHKALQFQKLQKEYTILELKLTEKQQIAGQLNSQMLNLRKSYEDQVRKSKKFIQNIEFYQMEINSLSQEVDDLKRANEKYKNQLFRSKLIDEQKDPYQQSPQRKSRNIRKSKISQSALQRSPQVLHSKHRQKVLGQIQQLIDRHKNSAYSESEDSDNEY